MTTCPPTAYAAAPSSSADLAAPAPSWIGTGPTSRPNRAESVARTSRSSARPDRGGPWRRSTPRPQSRLPEPLRRCSRVPARCARPAVAPVRPARRSAPGVGAAAVASCQRAKPSSPPQSFPIFSYSRRVAWSTCSISMRPTVARCEEGGVEHDVADAAAGDLELAREGLEVQVADRTARRRVCADARSCGGSTRRGTGTRPRSGCRRMNASSMFSRRFVASITTPVVALHPLQQVARLDVRVAVVRVRDLGPLAEERVRLVEEEDRVAGRSLVEDRARGSSPSRRCTCSRRRRDRPCTGRARARRR